MRGWLVSSSGTILLCIAIMTVTLVIYRRDVHGDGDCTTPQNLQESRRDGKKCCGTGWGWNSIVRDSRGNVVLFDFYGVTVKPLMFACPLFREFCKPNKTAKLKGANINCRPKKDKITTVFRIIWFYSPK